jgi:gliding motility-associated-like protein
MSKFIKSIFFSLLLMLCSNVNAITFYVNDNSTSGDVFTLAIGNNGNSGLTTSLPKLTLANAIAAASAGDTIKIDKGNYVENSISFNKSLVIIGAGPGLTIFTGNATVNRFGTIAANNVTIKNITLRNYYLNADGQVMTMTGRTGIVFENIVVKDNQGSATAGVNFLIVNSTATFKACLFSCSGWNADGGGTIKADNSNVTIQSCVFKEVRNFATSGDGGAVELTGSSPVVTITNSTFDSCSARRGGAISQVGTGASTLSVTGCCFTNNFTAGDGSDPANGGGAFYSKSIAGSTTSFTNCTFTNNKVDKNGDQNASCDGGAVLFRAASGTFSFDKCAFSNISASSYDKGQDFYIDEGTLTGTISNCTFSASTNASGGNKVNIYNFDLEAADVVITHCNTWTFTAGGAGAAFSTIDALAPVWDATFLAPNTNCIDASSIAACGVTVNCATEMNSPIIIACVVDKTITDCSPLPDYRSEVSAFDDCSYTVSQSPLPGTILANGVTIVTMTVTDGHSVPVTCTFNVTVSGCVGCVDPGAPTGSATQFFCSDASATVASLSATGAGILWYAAASGGSSLDPSTPLVNGSHYYASQTVGACESALRLDVTVTITTAANAGTASTLDATLCTGTSTTVSSTLPGGTWSSSAPLVATVDPITGVVNALTAGPATMTYTVLGTAGCLGSDATSTVLITVTQAANAGTASTLDATLCTGTSTTVSSTLPGGTWSSSAPLVATVDPITGVVNALTAGPATMTYTVLGTAGCLGSDATSTVLITVTQAANAGTASTLDATLCTGTSTTVSSTLPGGTWSSSAPLVATVDPNTGVVNALTAGPATMTYTVLGTAGCLGSDATSTVLITVTQAANAGTASTLDATLCTGTSTTVSSTLPGGTWSSSAPLVATVDPITGVVNALTAGPATMTYTVLGTAGCLGSDATSTVLITVTQAATAGTASALDATLCEGTSTTVSSTLPGGTWSSSAPLVATVDANTGVVNALTGGTATMTYTVLGTAGCLGSDATSTVLITVTPTTDAGVLSPVGASLCIGLTTPLSSNVPGGTWTSSAPLVATIDLNTGVVTGVSAGTITVTYTVLGTAGCVGTNDFATVDVTVISTPDAGILSAIDQAICTGSSTTVTSTSLGGTWLSSDISVATVDPNTGVVNALTAGMSTMTYTVVASGGCVGLDATATIDITVTQAATAGTASTLDATLCTGTSTTVSSTLPGGTWSSSAPLVATVDAITGVVNALTAGPATMTYTVLGTAGCLGSDATSTVLITVTQAATAGTASTLDATLCTGTSTTVSSTLPGGTWSSSAPLVATVDPITGVVNALTAGPATMTYTVLGTAGCLGSDATSTVLITVTQAANAGTTSTLDATLCTGTSTTVSSTLPGGTWSSSAPLVATVDPITGVVNALTAGPATMTYTVLGTAGCLGSDATSTVLITVTQAANAGTASTLDATLCTGTSTTVSSTQAGGTWSSSAPLVATVDPNTGVVNALTAGPATMTYTVLGTAGCLGSDATSTVLITVTQAANAGTASTLDATLCTGTSTTVSSTLPGGTWSSSAPLVATVDPITGVVNALTAGPATMTYTVLGTAGCLGSDATSTVLITVTQAANAGTASSLDATLCTGTSTTVSSTLPGGTWSSSAPLVATVDPIAGVVSALTAGPATMTYTVLGTAGCLGSDATSTVLITVTQAANAGTASTLDATLCTGTSTTVSSTLPGGTWSSSAPLVATVDPITGVVNALTAGPATMTYTVLGTAGCLGSDATSTVLITVSSTTTPIITEVLQPTCTTSTATVNFSGLPASGNWTVTSSPTVFTVNGTGPATTASMTGMTAGITYTFTATNSEGCVSTATSSVIIGAQPIIPLAPTGDLIQEFCVTALSEVSNLTTLAGSNIQWYDAAVSGNLLDPQTPLEDGVHYYATQTVAGCESSLSLDVVVQLDALELVSVSQIQPICGQENGSITVNGINGMGANTYTWSNGASGSTLSGIGNGQYTVTVVDSLGCSDGLVVDIECLPIIPEIITANGNGKNDTWILYLDAKAKVQIYNRWGSLVYSASPYLDDWDGKANTGGTVGNEYLPSGTYFYIIDYNNGEKPVSGYIEFIK